MATKTIAHRKGRMSDCAGLWSWMSDREAEEIKKSIEKRRALSRAAKKENVEKY
ncbi:MAG: hypothetical protein HYW25_00305 [Candidatus Aenigmarchaeota archaeon]|nr:hypothetical protein [Candidatus Aenigmarchaeota archaeon]